MAELASSYEVLVVPETSAHFGKGMAFTVQAECTLSLGEWFNTSYLTTSP